MERRTSSGTDQRAKPQYRARSAELGFLRSRRRCAPLARPSAGRAAHLRHADPARGQADARQHRQIRSGRSSDAAPVAGLSLPRPEPSSGTPKRWPPHRAFTGQAGRRPIPPVELTAAIAPRTSTNRNPLPKLIVRALRAVAGSPWRSGTQSSRASAACTRQNETPLDATRRVCKAGVTQRSSLSVGGGRVPVRPDEGNGDPVSGPRLATRQGAQRSC